MRSYHYWNQDNFEGLDLIARLLRGDLYLHHVGAYCELRSKGLRSQAFSELSKFITMAQSWSVRVQREQTVRMLDIHWANRRVHHFLPNPLRTKLIEPVLVRWLQDEQESVVPRRWLGLLRNDVNLLQLALEIDSHDDPVRDALTCHYLRFADYASHHLVESKFIGDASEALAALDSADALLSEAVSSSRFQELHRESHVLRRLILAWLTYKKHPEGTFPEWCERRGKSHGWYNIVYYEH